MQEVAREVADLLEPKRQSRKPAVYRGLAATALAAAVSLAAWARGQLVAYGDERAAEAKARIERAERDRDLSDLARLAHETATANSARLDSLARQVDLLLAEVRADRAERAGIQRARRR